MAKRQHAIHQTAMPLNKRFLDGSLTRKKVADLLGIGVQNVTNWLRRGVPAEKIDEVAAICGLTESEYKSEAGIRVKSVTKPRQADLGNSAILDHLDALPVYLQDYLLKKTEELRKRWEKIPAWLREKLAPPKDPASYREWERNIEGLMNKLSRGDDE